MLEKKLIELETKFTFQEDLLDQLNKIVAKQEFKIDKLVKQIKALEDLTKAISESGDVVNLDNEVPPHY
jgi:SlyX protein